MYLIHKQSKNYYIWRSKSCVFCFKQFPLNIKQKFESPYYFIDGKRLLSVVVGVTTFSVEKL